MGLTDRACDPLNWDQRSDSAVLNPTNGTHDKFGLMHSPPGRLRALGFATDARAPGKIFQILGLPEVWFLSPARWWYTDKTANAAAVL